MQRYYGISLCRTGTSSLYRAMNNFGFLSRHYMSWQGYKDIIDILEFANDLPIPLEYKKLDKRYPGSKFIFPDRDVESWLDSYELHWSRTNFLTCSNWADYHKRLFGTLEFDREVWGRRFKLHRLEVLHYFRDRPDDLLVLEMPYREDALKMLSEFVKRQPKVMRMPWECGSYSRTNGWCPRSERRD